MSHTPNATTIRELCAAYMISSEADEPAALADLRAAFVAPGPSLSDERIFAIRDAIKTGDGWDGDQWDLALARAIESELRAALAAVPGKGEPVAQICGTWELRWIGSGPIAPIVHQHGLKIGDFLYPAPVGEVVTATDLAKLTRLGWSEAYIGDSSELVEDTHGTYVRFADVEALLAALPQDLTGEKK